LTGDFNSTIYKEGYKLKIPFITREIIFPTRTQFIEESTTTANRDLQRIDFTIRVLYKPDPENLIEITKTLGPKYADKLLSPIVKEVAKTVIAQYTAQQLLSQREQVSSDIKVVLKDRLGFFNILIDEVSITQTSFSREYEKAIEQKQIAQQTAERMKYLVEKALQVKKSAIITAEADCKSIELIGEAVKENPAYLTLQRIEAAKEIADMLQKTKNKVLLDSNILLLDTVKS
jgi:prohibitin 2